MLPMKALRLKFGTALAADSTSLAPAVTGNDVFLIKEDFAEVESVVIGDLTKADFDGYADIVGSTGAQQTGTDPVTGEQLVTIKEPLGGWRFACTGPTLLPMTIYGYGLKITGAGALLGLHRFDEPITLTESGQEINLGTVAIRIVTRPAD